MYVVVAFETYSVAQVQSVLLTSFLKKYLFIWLHQVFVVVCRIFHCVVQALEGTGLVALCHVGS